MSDEAGTNMFEESFEGVTLERYEEMFDAGLVAPCAPGDEEWLRRRAMFLADDREGWWWLSFIDTDLPYTEEGDYPGGPRHLGVCIVPGGNIVQACAVAWELGCNPGGQVAGYQIPGAPKAEYVGKLFKGQDALDLAAREWEDVQA